jgi:hypothetical protein
MTVPIHVQNKLPRLHRAGKPWRHPQQIVKLLRSFGGDRWP